MCPTIGDSDQFEGAYTQEFKALACKQGEFVLYERDRAAIDLGVHLTRPATSGRELSHTRIWFQLKGIRATTLPRAEYDQLSEISLQVRLDHLKFWFASAEPIYLALYVECVNKFLVEDIQEIVCRRWGEEFLRPDCFPPGQELVTIRLGKDTELSPAKWVAMRRHHSMRIDGPFFRGRPLGHRLDPLRCMLHELEPKAFCRLIARLLDVHGYRVAQRVDPGLLFPGVEIATEHAALSSGSLLHTLEWVWQMSTQFGIGPAEDDFRTEGKVLSAQGACAVFVHGQPRSYPDGRALRSFLESLRQQGSRQLLVFSNLKSDAGYFGAFFSAARDAGVACVPLLLGETAYVLLTTTMVYLEFREAVSWSCKNYLW